MGGREEEEGSRYLYQFLGAAHPFGHPYKFYFQGRLTPQAAPEEPPLEMKFVGAAHPPTHS